MTPYSRLACFGALALALVAGSRSPIPEAPADSAGGLATIGIEDGTLERAVDQYLHHWQALGTFSGAVLIARQDSVLLKKGYGMASQALSVPNTAGQKFRIASVSKPFTEVALARLADQGKLALDAPISRFLPRYPEADRITVRMLMEHTAGVPNVNSIPYDEEAIPANTLDSLVHALERLPLDYRPGTRRSYSNGGYALLAWIIERVSGESYGEFVRSAVLAPLGLEDTGNERDGEVVPGLATGYEPSSTERGRSELAPYQQMATKQGGGSLYSTVSDLFRFTRALYHENVISSERYRELFPPRDGLVEFDGRSPGYMAYVRKDLDPDVTIIVLANNYSAMVRSIADGLAAILAGQAPEPVPWRADIESGRLVASDTGRFLPPPGSLPFLPANTPLRIGLRNGDLILTLTNRPVDVLLPQNDSTFLLRNMWATMTFHRAAGSASGVRYQFISRQGGFEARRTAGE